jgi:hypothetical protein
MEPDRRRNDDGPKPLPFFKERLKKISRELELHFGLEPVTNHREGPIKFAPTRAEDEQARRLGLDAVTRYGTLSATVGIVPIAAQLSGRA